MVLKLPCEAKLPVVSQFLQMTSLFFLDALADVKGSPKIPLTATFVIHWLDLAERLQLDELHQLCMDRLQGMTKELRKMAITVEVRMVAFMQKKRVLHKEVEGLGQGTCNELLALTAAS
ncbi:hypothetical protein FOA52_006520 [Chlamydomonas sp. UWO 241]|nr:hypothetical protein FOA52_006520 [Chlamydomonas sp. UWO 241]